MARLSVRLPPFSEGARDYVIVPGSPEAARGDAVTVFLENTKFSFEANVKAIKIVPANKLPSYVLEHWGISGSVAEFIGTFYGIEGLPEEIPVTIYLIESHGDV